MHQAQNQRPLVIALYVNAALLAGILLFLYSRHSAPPFLSAAYGQNQLPIGGGAGVFLVPAQFLDHSYGVYLMDIDAQTLCAYQFKNEKLNLIAARNFRWDRRLGQFNTGAPSPEDVRKMVEREQQGARILDGVEQAPVEAQQQQR
jgi:hypothetical protein